MPNYILLVLSHGDGSVDYGERPYAIRFKDAEACETACEWFKSLNCYVKIIEDSPS